MNHAYTQMISDLPQIFQPSRDINQQRLIPCKFRRRDFSPCIFCAEQSVSTLLDCLYLGCLCVSHIEGRWFSTSESIRVFPPGFSRSFIYSFVLPDPSARVSEGGELLFPSYVSLGWDQNSPPFQSYPINDTAKLGNIIGFGRPLWVNWRCFWNPLTLLHRWSP